MNAVGDFGHEGFGKAQGPVAVVVFGHGGEGEAASVGGVIVGAVVVHGPIHELEIGVGAVSNESGEIGGGEFSEAEFEAALREFAKNGEGRAVVGLHFFAEGDDLVEEEAGDVRGFAEQGIANDIEIREAGEAERFAEAVASGFLDVAENFGGAGEAEAGEEGEDAGAGVLGVWRKTVFALIGRMKIGMPL